MTDPLLFDYELPRDLIAQQPLRNRADARLMIVHRGRGIIEHHHVRDLPELARAGDCFVLNDTKVLPAQLVGARVGTGGKWQGLYLGSDPDGHWRIVCKTRGKLAPGDSVMLDDRDGRPVERLWLLERIEGGQWLAHPDSDKPVEALLNQIGRVPLPHYIRSGRMVDADVQDYQTVFARRAGSAAAPTAGLHFTPELLQKLGRKGAEFAPVTLHVGLGTFRPITTERVEDHSMHTEWCQLSQESAAKVNQAKERGSRVIAVGTTSVRTLETAAQKAMEIGSAGPVAAWEGETNLFLRPGVEFRAVDALLTNFHFPKTTLLVLVQTFGGVELIRRAYHEAIAERYRFYSYGDAMLIL